MIQNIDFKRRLIPKEICDKGGSSNWWATYKLLDKLS